jgi:N-acetylmuramoyl-L-alanine amidase
MEVAKTTAPWLPLLQWAGTSGLGPLRRISYSDDPVFELTTPHGPFLFQVRTRQAAWKGLQLHLGFAPMMIGEEPCLHLLDVSRNLEPLLKAGPWLPPEPGVIVVDAGHGGSQGGSQSVLDGSFEKAHTLDWALRLRPLLEEAGWQVHLTRTNDSELPLADRVAFAWEMGADLFLSLHFNASGNGNHQAGLETYCLTPTGMPSTLTRGYADDPSEVLPNNAFDAENLRLASALHESLLRVNGGLDRGVRRARFMTVLRGQRCPAVLIEGGYLSNPEEAARIADPQFRQRLAEAVARVLAPVANGLTGAGGQRRSGATP